MVNTWGNLTAYIPWHWTGGSQREGEEERERDGEEGVVKGGRGVIEDEGVRRKERLGQQGKEVEKDERNQEMQRVDVSCDFLFFLLTLQSRFEVPEAFSSLANEQVKPKGHI